MKPVLLLVIEDAASRRHMTAELASRFARDYVIEASPSAEAALERLRAFDAGQVPVAMVLADVDMRSADSIEFLSQVRGLIPTATRILLHGRDPGVAGGAVRHAAVLGRIDSALAKPTGPRDEDFFGTLTEYLADWAWITRPVVDAVKIVGSETAAAERRMVDILRASRHPCRDLRS